MIIYKTINLINGKQYIGSSINNKPNYLGSGKWVKLAIKKYGKENFRKEILEHCNNFEQLKEREEYWIKHYDAFNNTKFYNATKLYCGNSYISDNHKQIISKINKGNKYNLGKHHTEETKQKIGNSNKGKIRTEEAKQLIGISKLGNKYALGNKLSQETKDKISYKKTNHLCYKDPEFKEKISKANKGKIRTEEHKLNYSNALKNKPRKKNKIILLNSNINQIKEQYTYMTTSELAKFYKVSSTIIRLFLKNNNMFEFRKNIIK